MDHAEMLRKAIQGSQTRKERKRQEKQDELAVCRIRRSEEGQNSQILGYGFVVKNLQIKPCYYHRFCLISSDKVFPNDDLNIESYYLDFKKLKSNKLKTIQLRDIVVKSTSIHRISGLAVIPVSPVQCSAKESIFKYRPFEVTKEGRQPDDMLRCYFLNESSASKLFDVKQRKQQQQKWQTMKQSDVPGQYNLPEVDGTDVTCEGDLAVILKHSNDKFTVLGALTFKDDEHQKISPVFFDKPLLSDISAAEGSSRRELPCSSDRPDAEQSRIADISAAEGSSRRESPCSSDRPDAEQSRIAEPFDLKECQRQLQDIYNTTSKVKIIPWNSESVVHITEIYTQLSWVKDDRKASGVTKERLADYTDIFKGDKHYAKPKRILVYGRPGIGKTVFTQKTTFDWSQQRNEVFRKFDLVLLIKLRDVCDLQDIHAILSASELLASDGMISVDNLYDYILKNQERVLLILDGYDEYSAGTSSPVVDIWEGRLLRDCHVIMTTRELKSGKLTKHSHVQFEINGFDSVDQIKRFAGKILKDENDVQEFLKDLWKKDLGNVAEIPLLLLMLCVLWNDKANHTGLPKSRANIYTSFIQTLLNHMSEKHADSEKTENFDVYKETFCQLGMLAFNALLQDCLFLHFSELPVDDPLITKLIEAGLFQMLNLKSLNPEKGIFFVHKSIQEFLAAFYLKEELFKEQSTSCLSKVDSFEKILKMVEVLKFACELSAEAACAVLHHLGMVGKKEGLMEFNFTETPSLRYLSEVQRWFLTLISHSFFCCAADKRRDLYSMFLSYVGGVLLIDSDQLHSVASEHLLKSAEAPEFIFFSRSSNDKHSEQSYHDLITVVGDVNAVVVSCSGEKKASDFLKKYPFLPVRHFFLKKKGTKINIYMTEIIKDSEFAFPTEMLKEVISSPESTQKKKKPVGDQSNEEDSRTALCLNDNNDSSTDAPRHCLSCVRSIHINDIESQEMETLVEVLAFVTSPQAIWIIGKLDVPELSETLTDTLVSRINFTNRLESLVLRHINLTAKAAAVIARSLPQAPNLRVLGLSFNPLGEGVSDLTRHLSCVPHLEYLNLYAVKMTKKQVNDLTEAVRQSNISTLESRYHDYDETGNPKPEHEWPTGGLLEVAAVAGA